MDISTSLVTGLGRHGHIRTTNWWIRSLLEQRSRRRGIRGGTCMILVMCAIKAWPARADIPRMIRQCCTRIRGLDPPLLFCRWVTSECRTRMRLASASERARVGRECDRVKTNYQFLKNAKLSASDWKCCPPKQGRLRVARPHAAKICPKSASAPGLPLPRTCTVTTVTDRLWLRLQRAPASRA